VGPGLGEAAMEALVSRLEAGMGCEEDVPILRLKSLKIAYPGPEVTIGDAGISPTLRLRDMFNSGKARRETFRCSWLAHMGLAGRNLGSLTGVRLTITY
jgi:hypothetical protein